MDKSGTSLPDPSLKGEKLEEDCNTYLKHSTPGKCYEDGFYAQVDDISPNRPLYLSNSYPSQVEGKENRCPAALEMRDTLLPHENSQNALTISPPISGERTANRSSVAPVIKDTILSHEHYQKAVLSSSNSPEEGKEKRHSVSPEMRDALMRYKPSQKEFKNSSHSPEKGKENRISDALVIADTLLPHEHSQNTVENFSHSQQEQSQKALTNSSYAPKESKENERSVAPGLSFAQLPHDHSKKTLKTFPHLSNEGKEKCNSDFAMTRDTLLPYEYSQRDLSNSSHLLKGRKEERNYVNPITKDALLPHEHSPRAISNSSHLPNGSKKRRQIAAPVKRHILSGHEHSERVLSNSPNGGREKRSYVAPLTRETLLPHEHSQRALSNSHLSQMRIAKRRCVVPVIRYTLPNKHCGTDGICEAGYKKANQSIRIKEIHNQREKHRRDTFNECLDSLKKVLPNGDDNMSRLKIVQEAKKCIKDLTLKAKDVERLRQENVQLLQMLDIFCSGIEKASQAAGIDVNNIISEAYTEATRSAPAKKTPMTSKVLSALSAHKPNSSEMNAAQHAKVEEGHQVCFQPLRRQEKSSRRKVKLSDNERAIIAAEVLVSFLGGRGIRINAVQPEHSQENENETQEIDLRHYQQQEDETHEPEDGCSKYKKS